MILESALITIKDFYLIRERKISFKYFWIISYSNINTFKFCFWHLLLTLRKRIIFRWNVRLPGISTKYEMHKSLYIPLPQNQTKSLQKSLFSAKKYTYARVFLEKKKEEQNQIKRDLGWKPSPGSKSPLCLAQRETERIDSYMARRWYARVIRYNRIMRAAICGRKSGRSRPRLEHSVFCGLPWGTRIRL